MNRLLLSIAVPLSPSRPVRGLDRRQAGERPLAEHSACARSEDEVAADSPFARILQRKPIPSEQEAALSRRARKGDVRARWELALSNARFGYSIARSYAGHGVPVTDLFAVALVAMSEAGAKFDARLGKFVTYAHSKIRQRIQSAIAAEGRPYGHAVSIERLRGKVRKALCEGPRPLSVDELAEQFQVRSDTIATVLETLAEPVRLDAHVGDGPRATAFSEIVPDREAVMPWERMISAEAADELDGLLKYLSPRERSVISARFGLGGQDPTTFQEIADGLKVTAERVRQIEFRALKRMRAEARRRAARQRLKEPATVAA